MSKPTEPNPNPSPNANPNPTPNSNPRTNPPNRFKPDPGLHPRPPDWSAQAPRDATRRRVRADRGLTAPEGSPSGCCRPDPPPLNGTFLSGYADPSGEPDCHDPGGCPTRRLLQTYPGAGGRGVARTETARPAELELILGRSNLVPFEFLRNGDRVGRAVVKLKRADGASGTAFLVAPGVLLTNHHVLPDAETAALAFAQANYEARPPDDPEGRPLSVLLSPGDLFVTHEDLDFTFCGVRGLDHLGVIPLRRDAAEPERSASVNIIQHPGGRPKEVALQDNEVVKIDRVVVHYSCDTEPGSSGSPVFDNRWQLVALHHASVPVDEAAGGRPSPGGHPDLHYLNEGIRVSAIALWLDTAEADAPALREQTGRLRAIIGGLDPRAGFFGGIGRRSAGRRGARFVVECYRGHGVTLDLGGWDLTGPDAPPDDELADALAELRLDAWGLIGLDADAAFRLCEAIEARHRLVYHVLPAAAGADAPPEGEPPLVILHRASLAVEPVAGGPGLSARVAGGGRDDRAVALRLLPPGRTPPEATGPVESDTIVLAPSATAGGLLVRPRPGSSLERVYVAGDPSALGPEPTGLVTPADRLIPEKALAISGRRPIAARLLFHEAEEELAPPPAGPTAPPPPPPPAPSLPEASARRRRRRRKGGGATGSPHLDRHALAELERTLDSLVSRLVERLVERSQGEEGRDG